MSSKENTIMDYMLRKGVYKPPNPLGFVELTKRIIEAFRNINGTIDNEKRKMFLQNLFDGNEGNCYQEFLETLESEKDGKTPKERYRDFINEIAENGIQYDFR